MTQTNQVVPPTPLARAQAAQATFRTALARLEGGSNVRKLEGDIVDLTAAVTEVGERLTASIFDANETATIAEGMATAMETAAGPPEVNQPGG